MYTHGITKCNFYNIYNIYKCTHFNFLIYKISIEIVIFCNYTHTNLENVFCISIHIYVIYIME